MLMKGNEAIAEAAVRAGCRYFFGYPITPQNQIPEYMSKRMPQVGGTFLQAESEVSAINMVYGAAGSGARVMTSSSGPGISLKQEGISYIVGAELPCVIVNIMRGGPGLGSIQPAQSDYYQATRGGGHGDYRIPVLAPSSVPEAVELTIKAFDIADEYRTPVIVLGDGMIGQMMEPVDLPDELTRQLPAKPWAAGGRGAKPDADGADEGRRAIINSLYIDPQVLENHNIKLQGKYSRIAAEQLLFGSEMVEDADIVIVAYGTVARIVRSAIRLARAEGIKAGMIRPITLWPFPEAPIADAAKTARVFLTVEMSAGQMVDDVRLALNGARPSHFYGRTGGMVPAVRDVLDQIRRLAGAGQSPAIKEVLV
jgi:2-oxoglutarate ferredoxin oxidoreductase subunit alpha